MLTDRDPALPTPAIRERLDEHFAKVGHALSSPARLRIVALLSHAPRTVERLAELIGGSVANTSAHLKVLREAQLVVAQREGRFVRYQLTTPEVMAIVGQIQALATAVMPAVREVRDAYYASDPTLELHELAALWPEIEAGKVTLIDLRPHDEYEAGHIAHARSVPLSDLDTAALGKLTSKVVVYCRGPWCVMARRGAARMAERVPKRTTVLRLLGAAPDWERAGGAIERAA